MKKIIKIITAMAFIYVATNCISFGGEFDPATYDFSEADQKSAMKALDLKEIRVIHGKASQGAIKSGSGMMKNQTCWSSAENQASSAKLQEQTVVESDGSATISELSGTVQGISILACRSTFNNFEECECHAGFK